MPMAKTSEVTAIDRKTISKARRSLKATDMREVRNEIGQLVSNHAFGMVLRTIEEAHKGHYAAMKFLFEMTGLYQASSVEDSREGDGLAKLLLEQLGISPEPEGDAIVDSLQLARVETRHAVK